MQLDKVDRYSRLSIKAINVKATLKMSHKFGLQFPIVVREDLSRLGTRQTRILLNK